MSPDNNSGFWNKGFLGKQKFEAHRVLIDGYFDRLVKVNKNADAVVRPALYELYSSYHRVPNDVYEAREIEFQQLQRKEYDSAVRQTIEVMQIAASVFKPTDITWERISGLDPMAMFVLKALRPDIGSDPKVLSYIRSNWCYGDIPNEVYEELFQIESDKEFREKFQAFQFDNGYCLKSQALQRIGLPDAV